MSDGKTTMGPTIGFIGTGLLGGPIVLRLLDRGYRVIVHDIDRAKLNPLSDRGAATAASPAEVTAAADIVQLCLISTAAVEDVVAGADGVIETADANKLLVDHSTTETATTKRLAAHLAAETGMGWVDAPVSGGPPAAAAGALTIMAGGRAADFERVRPVLDAIAGSATRMGEVGAGQVTKMINQILVLNQYCVLAEALKLAENTGIDATRAARRIQPASPARQRGYFCHRPSDLPNRVQHDPRYALRLVNGSEVSPVVDECNRSVVGPCTDRLSR